MAVARNIEQLVTFLESHGLRVICNLGELALGGLELCVVLDVGLDLGVLRQPLVLGGVSHHRGLGLGHVGVAVGHLVEALVVLHVELHVADLAAEAVLVPHLLQALELLHGVDGLAALGAQLGHGAGAGRGSLQLQACHWCWSRAAAGHNYCQFMQQSQSSPCRAPPPYTGHAGRDHNNMMAQESKQEPQSGNTQLLKLSPVA